MFDDIERMCIWIDVQKSALATWIIPETSIVPKEDRKLSVRDCAITRAGTTGSVLFRISREYLYFYELDFFDIGRILHS
jgi:hypothetical protein